MFLFGFPSRIVYYVELSRGPRPIVGSCWLFYKESCVCVCVCAPYLLISSTHLTSLSVTIGHCALLSDHFCLVKKFICILFLEFTPKWCNRMLVFLCLTSPSVIITTPLLVAGHGVMSSFMTNIALCVCPHLFTLSSVLTHLGFFHVLALVHGAAMNIRVHLPLRLWFSLDLCPGMGLLGPMVLLC